MVGGFGMQLEAPGTAEGVHGMSSGAVVGCVGAFHAARGACSACVIQKNTKKYKCS